MSFHVGQKVVCVDGCYDGHPTRKSLSGESWRLVFPDVGQIYTIRGFWGRGVYLEEIVQPTCISFLETGEPNYRASRFRPLVEDRKSVSFTIGADPDSEHWDNRKKTKEKV